MIKYVYDKLYSFRDLKYKEFQAKLVPNIDPNSIIGVRTPDLKRIAKEVFNSEYRLEFLNDLPHKYYEENIVHMFIVSLYKDFNECVNGFDSFLKYANCWPVTDQASPKVFKKNHDELIKYVYKWIKSDHIYTSRFGIRILMNEYLGDDFKKEYIDLLLTKKEDDYYLKMMIAWFFATALAKRYDDVIIYLEEHKLDEWIHKKTIQKAIESYRVTDIHKEYLRSLR